MTLQTFEQFQINAGALGCLDISIVCPQCYFTFLLNIILSAFDAMFGQLFFLKQNDYRLRGRSLTKYVDQVLPIIDYLPTYPRLTLAKEFLYCYDRKSLFWSHFHSSCQRC